jgi:hypothetical protein
LAEIAAFLSFGRQTSIRGGVPAIAVSCAKMPMVIDRGRRLRARRPSFFRRRAALCRSMPVVALNYCADCYSTNYHAKNLFASAQIVANCFDSLRTILLIMNALSNSIIHVMNLKGDTPQKSLG